MLHHRLQFSVRQLMIGVIGIAIAMTFAGRAFRSPPFAVAVGWATLFLILTISVSAILALVVLQLVRIAAAGPTAEVGTTESRSTPSEPRDD